MYETLIGILILLALTLFVFLIAAALYEPIAAFVKWVEQLIARLRGNGSSFDEG